MIRRFSILLLTCLPMTLCHSSDDLSKADTHDLETRLTEIDSELKRLARFTLRSGVGNIGWVSESRTKPEHTEWAEIRWSKNTRFDRIVLVPVLWNDAEKGPQADGFPEAFKIVAGLEDDPNGRVIATRGPADHFLPRLAPLVIDIPPTEASWVRIESTQLSSHARDDAYRFKLSEIMVFSGQKNIALNQPVRVSSIIGGWGSAAIFKESLVDSLTPFLMDASGKGSTRPYMATSKNGAKFSLTIDLGDLYEIDGFRLHSAFTHEYIPQINSADFGLPIQLSVSGAKQANFSNATLLLHHQRTSIYHSGNILDWRLPKTKCRYVRMTVPKDAWPLDAKQQQHFIALDEIEVLSNGHNIAMGKEMRFPKRLPYRNHGEPSSLTNGQNHFGEIIPTREWMWQLALRHDLETLRPLIAEALNHKYLQQKANLQRMFWFATLLAAGIVFSILIGWILRMRAVLKTRERIAANLHDELSANLHALALLGDMAKKHISSRSKLEEVIDRIQQLSKRSRNAARHCTNMLQANTICEDLVTEMNYTADRLLANIQHTITFHGESILKQLPKRKRNDLFLFYKECLTNIARHAEATACKTHLLATSEQVQLVVTDNGLGTTSTPPSLKRRANFLRANVQTETPEGGGTRITLSFHPRINLFSSTANTNNKNPHEKS